MTEYIFIYKPRYPSNDIRERDSRKYVVLFISSTIKI